MKLCPNCKAALDDNARFCLCCMTSLEEKEQIQPPVRKARRWPLVLLCLLLSAVLLVFVIVFSSHTPEESALTSQPDNKPMPDIVEDPSTRTCVVDGVSYTFRPATKEDHPTAMTLDNHYVLIRVDGTPSDDIYRVPTFVGQDINALVSVIADGAFSGTNAKAIDLGHNVRYVWGDAFGGYALTDLYLHEDVLIEEAAFSGCTEELTVHCPEYLENTQGILWPDLCTDYGFRWQQENF